MRDDEENKVFFLFLSFTIISAGLIMLALWGQTI